MKVYFNYDVFEESTIIWKILPIVCLSKATAEEEIKKLLAIEAKNKNLSSKDLSLLKDNKIEIKYTWEDEEEIENVFKIIELETLP